MEFLFEVFGEFFFEVIFPLLFAGPITLIDQALSERKSPKWVKILLIALVIVLILAVMAAIVVGAVFMAKAESKSQTTWGSVLLSVGLTLFVGYNVFSIVVFAVKKDREKKDVKRIMREIAAEKANGSAVIGCKAHIVIDRPLGSVHPVHDDIIYEVNYGYCPDCVGGDGKEHDAYVLGVDEPIAEIDGVIVAIIHRHNDNEDKWVVVPEGYEEITNEEIIEKTYFLERYFDSTLIR